MAGYATAKTEMTAQQEEQTSSPGAQELR